MYGDQCVVQEYLHEPLLLDGYKFDLRMYVLVTSFNPLEAFVYDEGFARLSTVLYSSDPANIKNLVCFYLSIYMLYSHQNINSNYMPLNIL